MRTALDLLHTAGPATRRGAAKRPHRASISSLPASWPRARPPRSTAPLDHLQARAERLQYNLIDGQIYLEDAQEVTLKKTAQRDPRAKPSLYAGTARPHGSIPVAGQRPRLAAGRNGRPAGPTARSPLAREAGGPAPGPEPGHLAPRRGEAELPGHGPLDARDIHFWLHESPQEKLPLARRREGRTPRAVPGVRVSSPIDCWPKGTWWALRRNFPPGSIAWKSGSPARRPPGPAAPRCRTALAGRSVDLGPLRRRSAGRALAASPLAALAAGRQDPQRPAAGSPHGNQRPLAASPRAHAGPAAWRPDRGHGRRQRETARDPDGPARRSAAAGHRPSCTPWRPTRRRPRSRSRASRPTWRAAA